MTTEISRTASEIAHAIRFYNRMDGAIIEARRPDEAKGMTAHVRRGPSFAQVLADAGMAANARKEALEASLATMEPETVADALVLAVLAYSAFALFEDGVDLEGAALTTDTSIMKADRDRAMQLMGAVVRGLENHCELTPDIETIVSHYAGTTRESWAAIEAEAERVASAVLENRQTAPAGNAPVVRTTPTREVSAREVADEVAAIPGGMT